MHKKDFPLALESAYFDTAAEGLPPCTSEDPFGAYSSAKSAGTPGRTKLFAQEAETLSLASQLLNTTPNCVVLLSSASEGLNHLAASISWRHGDEVVIDDLEFPSNVVLWLCLRNRGVKMHVVKSKNGVLELEDFIKVIGPRTRLVSVSQVSYKSGTFLPFLPDLARHAHERGALISVDATQALGRVPVDVRDIDFLVASSYKWLLGPHGLGIVYMSAEMQQRAVSSMAGWYSVKDLFATDRFENFSFKDSAARMALGMPNFPSIYALHQGLKYILACGVHSIDATLAPLVRSIRRGLQQRGVQLLTPADDRYASGIVSFSHPRCEQIGAALSRQGVIVWAGDGRIRTSIHLYNDSSDVDRLFAALDSADIASLL